MNACARCNWVLVPPDTLADHAEAAEHPLCTACAQLRRQHPVSLPSDRPRVCRDCQDRASQLLAEILEMWRELPDLLEQHAARTLPGGDALVLAGPGSRGPQDSDDAAVRWLISDNRAASTPSVAWTLISWEDDFRHVRGEHAASLPPNCSAAVVLAAADYLAEHAAWASEQHWAWGDYAADLAFVHAALMRVTGRHRAPTRLGLDCFACRGPLEYRIHPTDPTEAPEGPKWWLRKEVYGPIDQTEWTHRLGQAGLQEDVATCGRCGQVYNAEQLMNAKKDAVEKSQWLTDDEGQWGTAKAMTEGIARSESVLLGWRKAGLIRSCVIGGVVYLHLDDVLAHHRKLEDAQWLTDEAGSREWGTPRVVASHVDRSEWTLRTWQRQELIRSKWHDGALYLHLANVEAEVQLRTRRPRRGDGAAVSA
jgi:hypothetical protein